MCVYILCPAVALSRLGVDGEDRVVLTLRHPWRDGTTALRFEDGDYVNDFVSRLAALVPPRGQHTIRYHGALAPASPLRLRCVARWSSTGSEAAGTTTHIGGTPTFLVRRLPIPGATADITGGPGTLEAMIAGWRSVRTARSLRSIPRRDKATRLGAGWRGR